MLPGRAGADRLSTGTAGLLTHLRLLLCHVLRWCVRPLAKAGEAGKAGSLKRYAKDFAAETPVAVRLSMKNLSYDGKILNVPLFMIDELKRLIMTIKRK